MVDDSQERGSIFSVILSAISMAFINLASLSGGQPITSTCRGYGGPFTSHKSPAALTSANGPCPRAFIIRLFAAFSTLSYPRFHISRSFNPTTRCVEVSRRQVALFIIGSSAFALTRLFSTEKCFRFRMNLVNSSPSRISTDSGRPGREFLDSIEDSFWNMVLKWFHTMSLYSISQQSRIAEHSVGANAQSKNMSRTKVP
jgi:hypothetical protein